MLPASTDTELADQLLRISREPELRRAIYERIGEYCHQCRNRLNSLKLSLYLAMKQSSASAAWSDVDRRYRELELRVDRIQALCRPMSLSRVTLGIDLLIDDRREAWSRSMSESGRALEFVAPAEPAVASFDVERLGLALDLLVAWRSAEGPTADPARLRWWVAAGFAHLAWEESPVESGVEPVRPEVGAGTWSLPLLARIAQAHQGDCRIQGDPWKFEMSWPSNPPTP